MRTLPEQFLAFKKRNLLSSELISKIVSEYANSDQDFAKTYFTEKYNISAHVFYKCRDFAVVFCLVDDSTCCKLKQKTARNYSAKNPNGTAVSSVNHFNEIYQQRSDFLDTFTTQKIRYITNQYLNDISLDDIAEENYTKSFTIKFFIKKGITNLLVDKETVGKLQQKANDIIAFNNLLVQRESNKILLLDSIEEDIRIVQKRIKYYEFYEKNFNVKLESKKILEMLTSFYKEVAQL